MVATEYREHRGVCCVHSTSPTSNCITTLSISSGVLNGLPENVDTLVKLWQQRLQPCKNTSNSTGTLPRMLSNLKASLCCSQRILTHCLVVSKLCPVSVLMFSFLLLNVDWTCSTLARGAVTPLAFSFTLHDMNVASVVNSSLWRTTATSEDWWNAL